MEELEVIAIDHGWSLMIGYKRNYNGTRIKR